MERGANINFANIDAVTPLMAAVQCKRLNTLGFLLENGASLGPVERTNGRTALMLAAVTGGTEMVKSPGSCRSRNRRAR